MASKNPFEYKYPDDIRPEDVIDLFVPVFGEYYNIPVTGHTFINGARGSGKSMMFRYMKPDCQILVGDEGERLTNSRKIVELKYFALYIPIKKGQLNITDLKMKDKHGEALLNEHFMVTHFSLNIFNELKNTPFEEGDKGLNELIEFYNNSFIPLLKYSNYSTPPPPIEKCTTFESVFNAIINTLRDISSSFQRDYIIKSIGVEGYLPYNGPILGYLDFLYELLKDFQKLSFMPSAPIYLLIDDADELSSIQCKILNTWVAMRTSNEVSLKISTQLKYRVYSTVNNSRIDTPHDYSEVNLNDIYTTKKGLYLKRVTEIVSKRLHKFEFNNSPEDFFPVDKKQEEEIGKIAKKYMSLKVAEGQTEDQAYDFAYRYATPDYIKGLEGNRYTFSYAGFKELVHISSGIIREFIDFSSEMYEAQKSKNEDKEIKFIEPNIQDNIIKRYSERKLDSEFSKYKDEADTSSEKNDIEKLRNLIHAMGGLFKTILLSNRSERRVFSIALYDEPDEELNKILNIGIQFGYLQKSMIGNKQGTGKSKLYILSRVLAPYFTLDPSSFAGYQFMHSETLKVALVNPEQFISGFKRKYRTTEESDNQTLFNF